MALIKIRAKYQFTLPRFIRNELNWNVGDILYAKIEADNIVLEKSKNNGNDLDCIEITIRDRFQITLPKKIYTKMGIDDLAILDINIENSRIIICHKVQLVSAKGSILEITCTEKQVNSSSFQSDGLLKLTRSQKWRSK